MNERRLDGLVNAWLVARARASDDSKRLDFIERNCLEVSSQPDDGDTLWLVHRVDGWPNDREWYELGRGHTLRDAIDAARGKYDSRKN